MIEPLAEAIAALVKVLVDLIALMIEAMVWLVMMAIEANTGHAQTLDTPHDVATISRHDPGS